MKKTALQEAFSLLEELHPSLFDIHTEKGRTFVNTFHEFLELEKKQLFFSPNVSAKEAYKAGQKSMYCGCYDINGCTSYEEWLYDKTFKL